MADKMSSFRQLVTLRKINNTFVALERERARKGQQTRRGGRELNAVVVMPDKQKKKRKLQRHHSDPLKNVSRNLIPVDSYEGFVCITEDEKSVEF